MLQNLLDNLNLGDFNIVELLIRVFVIIISLSIHEASHAYRAYKLGDDTAQRAGRLTLNPLAHLDPLGTVMMFIARVGWAKPVPINPLLFTRAKTMKRGIVEVSLAGPVSNLILSFVSYFILNVIYFIDVLAAPDTETNSVVLVFMTIFQTMFQLNVFLAIFNLLPIPPLDGYKIFGSLLPGHLYYKLMDYERYIGIAFIAIIIFAGNIFSTVLFAIATPFFYIIQTPVDLLYMLMANLFLK
ncbi:MAG: site-2 protease family protein [Saccharofermentanales bacterium]